MKKQWRDLIQTMLSWPSLSLGMAAAVIGGANASALNQGLRISDSEADPVLLPNTLNATARDVYAAHRSHSSHASHGSHRSSSGGSYTPPSAPVPRIVPSPAAPTPNPTVAPRLEKPSPSPTPKPTPQDLSMMVVRVQAALMRQGYYEGDIDGILGPLMRTALTKYQKEKGLPVTGRMDIETLSNLGISIP